MAFFSVIKFKCDLSDHGFLVFKTNSDCSNTRIHALIYTCIIIYFYNSFLNKSKNAWYAKLLQVKVLPGTK